MREKGKMKKILLTTTLVAVSTFAVLGTNSKAVLQSNYSTHTKGTEKKGNEWIQEIREMEATGQTMGLNETINADLTPTTSNGIDVHMMRTTEYGAVAILSASGFGYSGKLQDAPVKSATGNVTGVYYTGTRYEWTAGVLLDTTVGKDERYYDLYTRAQTSAKVGDALGLDTYLDNPGCSGWHDAGEAEWLSGTYGFRRGVSGMFSFEHGNWKIKNCGRGVAVIGDNL